MTLPLLITVRLELGEDERPEVLVEVQQSLLHQLGHHDQRRPVGPEGLVGRGVPAEAVLRPLFRETEGAEHSAVIGDLSFLTL